MVDAPPDLAALVTQSLQTLPQRNPREIVASVMELCQQELGSAGTLPRVATAVRECLAEAESSCNGSVLLGRSSEALQEELGAPEDLDDECSHLFSDLARWERRTPEGSDHQYRLVAQRLRDGYESDDDNCDRRVAAVAATASGGGTTKATATTASTADSTAKAADSAVAILVAKGGEEHPLLDASHSAMVAEMLEGHDAASNGPLRVDVPFDSATVGKAAVLLASDHLVGLDLEIIGLGKGKDTEEGAGQQPGKLARPASGQHAQLLELWQCADFLMLPRPTCVGLASWLRLSLVDGIMGTPGGGKGAAVPLDHLSALLQRHVGCTAALNDAAALNRSSFVCNGSTGVRGALAYDGPVVGMEEDASALEAALIEELLLGRLDDDLVALRTVPQLSRPEDYATLGRPKKWAALYAAGEGGPLVDCRRETDQDPPDELSDVFGQPPPVRTDRRVPLRHRRVLRDNIQGITASDLDALLRQAGVAGADGLVYEESRGILKGWLEGVMRQAITSVVHRRERIVNAADVGRGLGATAVYGYGLPDVPTGIWSTQLYKVLKQVHPDTEIGAEGLAVADDYISDLLRRLVLAAVQLPTPQTLLKADPDDPPPKYVLSSIGKQLDLDRQGGEDGEDVDPEAVIAVEDDDKEETAGMQVVDSRCIQTAVRGILPGELAKHAVSEGTKAVTKFTSAVSEQRPGVEFEKFIHSPFSMLFGQRDDGRRSRSKTAGLQFSVEAVAALASKVCHGGVLLSEGAAVYLAAVLEYMSAELLELSGNAARDNKTGTITARHIGLALWHDEELDKMTSHAAIRGAGVLLRIDSALKKALSSSSSCSKECGFDAVFAEMVAAAPDRCLIDPRDGCHYTLVKGDGDGGGDEEAPYFVPVPALDMAASWPRGARQAAALACLSPTQRAAFDATRHSSDTTGASTADVPEQLVSRVAEIWKAQMRSTAPVFERAAFGRLVAEVAQDFQTDLRFTAECMDCLQVAAEHTLRAHFADANALALHGGRLGITVGDLQLSVPGGRRQHRR